MPTIEQLDDADRNAGLDPAWDDTSNASFYCEHGTYIGSPYGPDYMCGWCEDGISVDDMHEILEDRRRAVRRQVLDRAILIHGAVVDGMAKANQPYNAAVATWLVIHILHLTEGISLTGEL